MYAHVFKRVLDVILAAAGLALLAPLCLLVFLAIRIFDPGPAIFRQLRVGRGGCEFAFYKFRSMPVNTGDIPSDKLADVALSRVGKFIRRTNIDELPQLVNILKGDMSVVGPRPPIPAQTELVELRRRNGALNCRPGLTGLAQVNAFDGMSVEQKAAFDGQYAQSIGFLRDIAIIASTLLYLLKPPPKY
ncbi:sugar transferase [Sphingorhabdus sp.]|jgi:O-antigen biosynthesis protein WbqP|uniref:sugar transferase n=1 Tax=Sphingorhabdus sp. TaxID=1902408 RepID=UPI0035ADA856|nr:sugar transferase [Sphingomonadaceae bacterium]